MTAEKPHDQMGNNRCGKPPQGFCFFARRRGQEKSFLDESSKKQRQKDQPRNSGCQHHADDDVVATHEWAFRSTPSNPRSMVPWL